MYRFVICNLKGETLLLLPDITFFPVVIAILGKCPKGLGSPRKEVVCYYEGKRAISTLDSCFCTHLIYTNIGVDDYSQVELTKGKTENPNHISRVCKKYAQMTKNLSCQVSI